MRWRSVRAAIVVVAAALLGPPAAADLDPGGTFVDDDGSVHEASIEALVAAGITTGCSDDGSRFCPTETVTRGQMAAFLVRAVGLGPGNTTFADSADSVFVADIAAIADAGITRGCDPPANTVFCPGEPVTRGQMAAFLSRAFGLKGAAPAGFEDTAGSVFAQDVDRLAAAAIAVGCDPPGNTRFCPELPVSRAEMATFLVRALGLETPGVPNRALTLEVIPREGWGGAEPRGEFRSHGLDRLTVHHSGSPLSQNTGPAVFRGWQSYHFSLGWPDIAYHYIVGRDGLVYAARPEWAVGDTATEYDPTGHFLVVVEGDYDLLVPSENQLEALARILAWAAETYDIDPVTLTGHRDHAATSCPGETLYAVLSDGSLRQRVEQIISEGGVSLVPS